MKFDVFRAEPLQYMNFILSFIVLQFIRDSDVKESTCQLINRNFFPSFIQRISVEIVKGKNFTAWLKMVRKVCLYKIIEANYGSVLLDGTYSPC